MFCPITVEEHEVSKFLDELAKQSYHKTSTFEPDNLGKLNIHVIGLDINFDSDITNDPILRSLGFPKSLLAKSIFTVYIYTYGEYEYVLQTELKGLRRNGIARCYEWCFDHDVMATVIHDMIVELFKSKYL